MNSITTASWYRRVHGAELGSLTCPRCGHPYSVGPIFDHDPRRCSGCQTTLIEWSMITYIYLIDSERAPPIIQALVEHTAPLTEWEAEGRILDLMRFLGATQI